MKRCRHCIYCILSKVINVAKLQVTNCLLWIRLRYGYNQLRPSLLEKFATQDKVKVKWSIQQLLTWDFERVIMAHGSIQQDSKSQFKAGYEWFLEITL
ncbi:MAG: hypothetical protein V7K38_14670 [Nostoc sp.]|uniref:hypothetical protein n=1 Tax=Nostoc sp. TaxID=1180 RepID=UPI002FF7DF49